MGCIVSARRRQGDAYAHTGVMLGSESKDLLQGILRDEWNFDGLYVARSFRE
jgi:hypothetical protein